MTVRVAHNLKLLAQHTANGAPNLGEGMALKIKDGRRYMYIAHEHGPAAFSIFDVTEPSDPKMLWQKPLPHKRVRGNSLAMRGDILLMAYQAYDPGGKPAGFQVYDISKPAEPREITFYDLSGNDDHSVGVHYVSFMDGRYAHICASHPDFTPNHKDDYQFYQIVDLANPSKPTEVGRWWYPGTRKGDAVPPPPRHPKFDGGYRPHNTNVYPQRPDRAYVAYIDGGAWILDISDKSKPRPVGHLQYSPPYNGFTHTVLPLMERQLLVISDECVKDNGEDWPKLTWVVDARVEGNLVPIATLPLPPVEVFTRRGGRFGSHNMHENQPGPCSFRSETLVFATFFNGGVRAYDLSNPMQPREVGYFVPGTPKLSPKGSAQINDVWVDENRVVYAVDRFSGGLYTLEPTF